MIRIHQGHRIKTTVQVITLKKILSYIDYQFAFNCMNCIPDKYYEPFPYLRFSFV
jgi:hypothetical protein